MPTDDVQDLFDTGGEDEESTEPGEDAADPDDDEVAWDELESIDDEGGADQADSGGPEEAAGSARPSRRTEETGTGGRDERAATAPAESGADGGATSETRSPDRTGQLEDPPQSGGAASDASSRSDGVEDPPSEPPAGPDAEQGPPATESADDAKSPQSTASASGGASSADTDTTGAKSGGSSRLPTGIEALDDAMGGGVPPGRLVLLVADPGVQSELIVDSVLAQRDTLFISTDRPDWEVSKDIEPGLGSGEVEIRDHTPDSLLSGVDSLLDELGTSSNFVLDSVNELELVPRARYRIFLSDVKRRLFDTGSIGLLTGVTVDHESARDLTLRRADIVWRLQTRTVDHRIENRLSVPKFRGGAAVAETVKLELTDEVKVDPNWDSG